MVIKHESFEGLLTTANAPNYQGDDFWHQPGYQSIYEFASGLRLLQPLPNTGDDGVWTGDFGLGSDSWSLGNNGLLDDVDDVPVGTAYIVAYDFDSAMTFGFDTKVYKVGAYVDGYDDAVNHLLAFDSHGRVLSGAAITSVPVEDWGTNYIQVISKKPIHSIVFYGDRLVANDLTFDTSKADKIKGSKSGGKVNGTESDDLILGKNDRDKIKAKGGDDTIHGQGGNDKIHGDDGNDTIFGGEGADKLWGDEGQDTFIFDRVATGDTLKDFNPTQDTIVLTQAAFRSLAFGELSDDNFVSGNAATDGDDYIIYDPTTGLLLYDQDANGSIAPVEVAKLPGGLALSAADFFVA